MKLVRLTISSGRGPEEARRFVSSLAEALTAELTNAGAELVSRIVHGDVDAPLSVDLLLAWSGALPHSSFEGTHELIMPSPERGQRARKRWFVSVRLEREQGRAREPLCLADVTFQACRASGAGGQHVNRTASAVRAVHVPTGTVVRIESERSQHQNKQRALAVLTRTLERRQQDLRTEEGRSRRASAIQVERGRAVASWRMVRCKLTRI
jgi:peptide chain release factor